jgi:hypothetical protein
MAGRFPNAKKPGDFSPGFNLNGKREKLIL